MFDHCLKRLLLLPACLLISASAVDLTDEEFRKCVHRCGQQYTECANFAHGLWNDFSKNRAVIRRRLYKCCLLGERDRSKPSTLSFATCVRNKCKAKLWGCQVRRRHKKQRNWIA